MKKYKRLNNPPFFYADEFNEVPDQILSKLRQLAPEVLSVASGDSFVGLLWIKAYMPGAWGKTPYLLILKEGFYLFNEDGYDYVQHADVKQYVHTGSSLGAVFKSPQNGFESILIFSKESLLPSKKGLFELSLILSDCINKAVKNGHAKEEKDSMDNKSTIVMQEKEDSFRNASPLSKVYAVFFWLLILGYVIGGISLNTWNPMKMYETIAGKKNKSNKSKTEDSFDLNEQNTKLEEEIPTNRLNEDPLAKKLVGYEYTITWIRETRCDEGGGIGSPVCTVVLTEEKMTNVDEYTLETISRSNCPDEFWNGSCHHSFRINTWGKEVYE